MKLVGDIIAAFDAGQISRAQAVNLVEGLIAGAANEKAGLLDQWAMQIWAVTPDDVNFGVAYEQAYKALVARDEVGAKMAYTPNPEPDR